MLNTSFIKKSLVAGSVLLTGSVQAASLYFNDFQSGSALSEWSSTSTQPWGMQTAPDGSGTRNFLGFFGGDDATKLTLNTVPGNATRLRLEFDAYLMWSWDGNDNRSVNGIPLGPDIFGFRYGAAGASLMEQSWTFSHGDPALSPQSYCDNLGGSSCLPTTGAVERYTLGYRFGIDPVDADKATTTNAPMDSVYHFVWEGLHAGPNATFEFFSKGLQVRDDLAFKYQDEAWGLDNVRISAFPAAVTAVPEPATWHLMGMGMLVLLFSPWFRNTVYAKK
jgi:hypothetical protein